MILPHVCMQQNENGSITVTLEIDGKFRSSETFTDHENAFAEAIRLRDSFPMCNMSSYPFSPVTRKMVLTLNQDGEVLS